MYDYKLHSNYSYHFSDNQFIYIAITGTQPYYLVYNTLQISPNVLMYKIPTNNNYFLTGAIRNEIRSKGYGLIDKYAFLVSDSYYEGDL